MVKTEYWYRFEDSVWGDYDGERQITIRLFKFAVTKHTLRGVWLEYGIKKDKFVLANARKRFACPTLEEARESFMARKRMQLGILETQVENVRWVIEGADLLIAREIRNYENPVEASLATMEFGL